MKLTINRQESNSRGQLLLRTFFGWLYIVIPHYFVLFFVAIWYGILDFIKFWVVLFTGKIPQSTYEFQKKVWQWEVRLIAVLLNMRDGYPAIGPKGSDPDATVEFENPESVKRGLVLVRALFGWLYVGIPHGFLLMFVQIGVGFSVFISWWAILFTGKFPEGMFNFIVRYCRWSLRVALYMTYYSDDYPPFNGKE
jgi:hypothetical protein